MSEEASEPVMTGEPTADQVRRYLAVTGWDIGTQGAAATRWIRRGSSVRMVHKPSERDLDETVFQISIAENRHPADVRNDILDVDNPIHARVRAWAVFSACEQAAVIVRHQIDEAGDNGFYGFWDWPSVDTMGQQAMALADALEKTAAAIKAAASGPRPAPWHPLWTAVGRAAEFIVRAEPSEPDDLGEIKRRLGQLPAREDLR